MAKTNYSNMSKSKAKNTEPKEVTEAKVEETVEPVAENVSASIEPENVFGKVANCKKLNVRFGPGKDNEVDFVLNAGAKVKIILDQSTDDWYFITCKSGNGFCMKEFIEIKS